jgi:hypothetical protein
MYEPSEQEKYLTGFIIGNLLAKAKLYDKPFKENREDNRKFYKGNQWRRKQPSFKSKSVINLLSVIVRDQVAILTDRLPIIVANPVNSKTDKDLAAVITKLLRHVLYKNNIGMLNHKAAKVAAIEGTAYYRAHWNPLLSNGEGDIEITVERADNVLFDPSGEGNYYILEKNVTLAEIYRMFPEQAHKVKADTMEQKTLDTNARPSPTLPVASTDNSQVAIYDDANSDIVEQHKKVKFHIAWIKDGSTEKVAVDEVEPDNTKKKKSNKEVQYEYKVKYPYGRLVFIANEKIVLEDKPCVIKNKSLIRLSLDYDPESDINGISNIDYCKQTQIDYNEMSALIKDWLRAVTFPRFTYDPSTGIDPRKIKNSWGVGIPANPQLFRWEAPPPLPNDSFRYIGIQKENIEYVSGINDVTQGRRPANVSAASAIQMLQEASKTMIRPQARSLEQTLKELGLAIIDLIQYGYTEERMMHILDAEGNPDEPITINQKIVKDNVTKIKNDMSIGEYDVYVTPDSTLPISRMERYQMLTELYKQGAVDREALIEESGLPNKQEIKERMDAREQQANQQKQQEVQAEQQKKAMEEERKMKRDMSKIQVDAKYKEEDIQIRKEELALKARELELKEKEIQLKASTEIIKSKKEKKEKKKDE